VVPSEEDPNALVFTYRHKKNDVQKTHSVLESANIVATSLGSSFLQGMLNTTKKDHEIRYNKKNQPKLTSKSVGDESTGMGRKLIDVSNSIYLKSMGIIDQRGEVVKSQQHMFRRVHEFLQKMDELLPKIELGNDVVVESVTKGNEVYAFILYDYLKSMGKQVTMRAYSVQPDLAKSLNNIAQRCHFERLDFLEAPIENSTAEQVDIATVLDGTEQQVDQTIFQAIQAKAKLLISSQSSAELVGKFSGVSELGALMVFEAIETRMAKLVTDGIRALILQANGYETEVTERGNANEKEAIIIFATRTQEGMSPEQLEQKLKPIKDRFGISDILLEKMLKA